MPINKNFYNKKIESISIAELAQKLGCSLSKETEATITGVSSLAKASGDEISFVTNIQYLEKLKDSKLKYCIIEKGFLEKALKINPNIIYLYSDHAYHALALSLNIFYEVINSSPIISEDTNISASAQIGKNANIEAGVTIHERVKIGDNVNIGAGTVISSGVKIGDNVNIGCNNSISFASIGNNVEILNNSAIGQDGFGFALNVDKFEKMLQLGSVIIEDNVAIGSNVSIDRGSLEDTIIGFGTKIDNLVQIAHNVQIGKHCLITGQVGFAGSTNVGDYVVFGGQAGVAGHINIGSYNRFAAKSGITKNIADNSGDLYGMPAKEKKQWQKEQIALKKITNDLFKND